MKTTKCLTSTMTTLAVVALLSACATSGYKQADKTGAGIAEFGDEIVKVKQAVDAAMEHLGDTTESAAIDPRKAFQAFAKSVDRVESARDKADKRAQSVKAAGAAYFKQWEAQLANIENPDIRKLAEQRKSQLNAIFAKIQPLLEQAKNDFDPFMADLKDLRAFLGQDLTVAGVDAAKGIIKKTREHGVALQKSLDDLIAEMNSIAAALTPSKATTQ